MHDLRSTILLCIEVQSPVMSFLRTNLLLWAALLLVSGTTSTAQAPQVSQPTSVVPFAPLEQWRKSILSGDQLLFRSFYSWKPEAVIQNTAGQTDSRDEVAFWNNLKARDLKLQILESASPKPGLHEIVLQAEIKSGARNSDEIAYLLEGQLWQQQGDTWRMVVVKRGHLTSLQQPLTTKQEIYPAGVNARAEINEALGAAERDHKNVLLVFGANWCYDCHVLDLAFQRPDLAPLVKANYEVVHVDVGQGDKNQDLMKQYEVPMAKGIPGLAVLDGTGKLLFSQKKGEFEHARALTPKQLAQFLEQWKPQ
jgi:thioredoxin 1